MGLRDILKTETADAVAARAGVGRATVFRVAAGKSCQTRSLDKLSAATGLTREELLPPPTVKAKKPAPRTSRSARRR